MAAAECHQPKRRISKRRNARRSWRRQSPPPVELIANQRNPLLTATSKSNGIDSPESWCGPIWRATRNAFASWRYVFQTSVYATQNHTIQERLEALPDETVVITTAKVDKSGRIRPEHKGGTDQVVVLFLSCFNEIKKQGEKRRYRRPGPRRARRPRRRDARERGGFDEGGLEEYHSRRRPGRPLWGDRFEASPSREDWGWGGIGEETE